MRILTSLLCKVTLSSMIVTAPSLTGSSKDNGSERPYDKGALEPYYSLAVIKKYVNYSSLTASPIYSESDAGVAARDEESGRRPLELHPGEEKEKKSVAYHLAASWRGATSASSDGRMMNAASFHANAAAAMAAARSAEVRRVINEAVVLYSFMDLANTDLDPQAFEYAWRGYHNMVKKGLIRKTSVLTICDFSQPSYSKRLYVIDVRHKKLLYQTYVAHGQNSGGDYATSFSNEPESFKSSLGFYVTKRTYRGKNGLSLRISGVDTGYNDLASKRNIVLHGSSYVNPQYMSDFGSMGTSLGCPAMPTGMSSKVIRAVKNGSCLFIYHPTREYLDQSVVINNF